MDNNSTNVKCPRWHYRNVRAEVKRILDDASAGAGLKGAMVAYIEQRKDSLPLDMTAEQAVDTILETVDSFAVAHEEGKSAEDVKEIIRESVAEMEAPKAVAFLSVLEASFRACDVNAAGTDSVDGEALMKTIRSAAEDADGEDVAERIDRLAEMVCGDSLCAYVFAGGNDDIKTLVETQWDSEGEESDSETAEKIRDAILARSAKAETYAATACACYGMVLDGKVKGVSASNLNVGVMTALIAGGLEKASILTRLVRGEIDAEVAQALLDGLARTLKWLIVKIMQVAFVICAAWAVGVLVTSSAWLVAAGGVFLTLGLLAGIGAAVELQESFEKAVDFIGELTASAVKCVCSAVKWVWNKCADAVRAVASCVNAPVAAS